jgi:hypothetical protein
MNWSLRRAPRPHEQRQTDDQRSGGGRSVEPFWASVVIRIATGADKRSLDRLAALDQMPRPTGATLIALLHQQPVAAVSLSDGNEIADPVVATVDILELLRLRARQLTAPRS